MSLLEGEKLARANGSRDLIARYRSDPLAFITAGLRECRGNSWRTWRIVLRAAYGQGLDDSTDLATFREVAQRDPPARRVKELWVIVGRRGGKDSVASMIATEAACYGDEGVALRPGERPLVACFATKRDQAGDIVFKYIRAYFEQHPRLRAMVLGDLPNTAARPITLTNRVDIGVTTNNFRAPRGRPIACAIFDEVAFWLDDDSATPDTETYNAVMPGLGTVPRSMLVGISSPYRKSGLLYAKHRDWFGRESDEILVIQGGTRTFNPTFDQSIIDRAIALDPEAARAEYLALFREDLADYVPLEVVERAVVPGRLALPREHGVQYVAFADPSGGSRDSFACAVAHATEDGRGVLDALYERRAPFVPSDAVEEIAKFLATYGLYKVTGDRYASEWPVDLFGKHSVEYVHAEMTKSEIYVNALPILMSGQVSFLDNQRLVRQVAQLERRTHRGGRDVVDHPPNANDDLANAALGALVLVTNKTGPIDVWRRLAS